MNQRLHELIKIFNSLHTNEDRLAFEAQWNVFFNNLESDQDKNFAIQTLQEAILGNLSVYKKEIEVLNEKGALTGEDVSKFTIPVNVLQKRPKYSK